MATKSSMSSSPQAHPPGAAKEPPKMQSPAGAGDGAGGGEARTDDALSDKSPSVKTMTVAAASSTAATSASSTTNDQTRSELLQKYNELRDIGQELIGMVAAQRGVSIRSLYEAGEFGVGPED